MKKLNQHLQRVQEVSGMGDIHAQIIAFFQKNPSPNDKQVHAFAEKIGMNEHELERHIYMLLSSVISGGKAPKYTGDYDSKQLEMGRKVEMEHTSEPLIAEKIAKDHLAELSDYYTRLKKMEEGAGVKHEQLSVLREIFVQMGEIYSMKPGPRRDMQLLRLAIIAEYDATNLYEEMAQLTDDENIRDVMLHVANEEKEHIGEFEFLLEHIDEDHEEHEDKGEDEAEEITGLGDEED